MASPIVIVDYGSQYTYLIARRLRSFDGGGQWCEIITPDGLANVTAENCSGVVLSGGPRSVSDHIVTSDELRIIRDPAIPVLGICYGMQLLGHVFGSTIASASEKAEYGPTAVCIADLTSPLFIGLPPMLRVWMSHGDQVTEDDLDNRCQITAFTADANVAAFQCDDYNCYGLQFHPEVQHTSHGVNILRNFACSICGLEHGTWSDHAQLDKCIQTVRSRVGENDRVILGLSGGVDSAVVAALLSQILPREQWLAVYVDHGLMRYNETEEIKQFAADLGFPFVCIDRSEQFFSALRGVTDAEHKRKLIGTLFIDAFQEAARQFKPTLLAQGTIYPDVVESAKAQNAAGGDSQQHVIKSHHNVGGLPAKLGLGLLEPLRWLFKDEVRNIGKVLNLPDQIVHRPPFPGPGIAIRIIGDVTREKVALVQRADYIFRREMQTNEIARVVPSQSYAALLPGQAVGVVGDQRRLGAIICLRAVQTDDFMTANVFHLSTEFLQTVATKIVNQCSDVARVVFDITPKPPGTIELE